MMERLFLDRVDAEAGRTSVGRQHHTVAYPLAHEARAALAVAQFAIAWAQVALQTTVRQVVPPACGERRGFGHARSECCVDESSGAAASVEACQWSTV